MEPEPLEEKNEEPYPYPEKKFAGSSALAIGFIEAYILLYELGGK